MKKTNTFVLPKKELFKIFGGVGNIMIKITVLRESKFICGRSHVERRDNCSKIWVRAKKFIGHSISLGRIFTG